MRVLVVDGQPQPRDGVRMDLVGAVRVLVLSQAPPDVPDGPVEPERDAAVVGAGIRRLTARERDVLRCLAKAYDNHEIGAELGIAVRTVNRHLEAIRAKLGTRRRSHLVRLARTAHAS